MVIFGLLAVITPVLSLANLSLPIEVAPVMTQQCSALPSFNETVQQILHILDNLTIPNNVNPYNLPQCSCAGKGSWTRVGYLDMSNSTFQCPSNWILLDTSVRGCKPKNNSGCNSAIFTAGSSTYNKVCGKVTGYQKGTTNAFVPYLSRSKTIEQDYVDGLSQTHGPPGSRKHIWTFAAALYEDNPIVYSPSSNCACTNIKFNWQHSTPSFINNNYFCDTGNPGPSYSRRDTIYSNDPLWDGSGCGPYSTCCQFNNPPWFCTSLLQPTTDDLELRICHDDDSSTENIIISSVEIYVLYD